MSKVNNIAINSFNSNHSTYDVFRPTFLKATVDRFLASADLALADNGYNTDKKILEIAAGTGKFTQNLVDDGWGASGSDNLVIVEPSMGMLQTFKKNFPGVTHVYEGSSYKIPVEDNSVDVILIAQGFHWFADKESLAEFYRVLKPGGKLGLIWNVDYPSNSLKDQTNASQKQQRDWSAHFVDSGSVYFGELDRTKEPLQVTKEYFHKQPWSEEVTQYIYSFDHSVPQYRHGKWRQLLETDNEYFRPIEEEVFSFYEMLIKPEDVFKYWETRSYITDLSSEKKAEIKAHVDTLLDKYVDSTSTKGDKLIKPMVVHGVVLSSKKE